MDPAAAVGAAAAEDNGGHTLLEAVDPFPDEVISARVAAAMVAEGEGGGFFGPRCAFCWKPWPSKRCSRCKGKDARYCDRDCQRKAWKKHKKVCQASASAENPIEAFDLIGRVNRLAERFGDLTSTISARGSGTDGGWFFADGNAEHMLRYTVPAQSSTVCIITPGAPHEGTTHLVLDTNAETRDVTLQFSDGVPRVQHLTHLALVGNPDPGDGYGGTHPTA
jgi:hypothetical protein